jgi:hypothetical protein
MLKFKINMMPPLYFIYSVLMRTNLLCINTFHLEPIKQYCAGLKCVSYSVTRVKTQLHVTNNWEKIYLCTTFLWLSSLWSKLRNCHNYFLSFHYHFKNEISCEQMLLSLKEIQFINFKNGQCWTKLAGTLWSLSTMWYNSFSYCLFM